jgi:hypothetical protein
MHHVPELEVLAALERELLLRLAVGAFHSQHDLLGSLRLLVENGLSLTTITGLLACDEYQYLFGGPREIVWLGTVGSKHTVITALPLSERRCLASL